MAFRPLPSALLTSLALAILLSGCADSLHGDAITVKQAAEVEQASGPDGNTGTCDGDGALSYTMTRRAGSLRILVADEQGNLLHDSGELDGAPDGFGSGAAQTIAGPAGVWTVSVEREGFTGSYTVSVSC
jgi:hypothetical protein